MKSTRVIMRVIVPVIVLLPMSLLAAPSNLKLRVTFPTQVNVFSAVAVEVILENNGSDKVTVIDFPTVSLLNVEIRSAKDDCLIYKGRVVTSRSSVAERYIPPLILGPSEKVSFQMLLRSKTDGKKLADAIFTVPGDYKLRFIYPISSQQGLDELWFYAESIWHDFAVVPARGYEAVALKAVYGLPQPGWILDPEEILVQTRDSNEEQARWDENLRSFVRDFPNSYWTPFAHLGLAYLHQGEKDRKALKEAIKHLDAVNEFMDFPLQQEAQRMKAFLQQRAGEKKK